MTTRKAFVTGFALQTYRATLQLSGSGKFYLEGITVARNIPQEMGYAYS